jgi:dnd system-associated protein 4|tara:strand:+ start:4644 stop:5072 length:429 start_codon:yes stop_codon:yes gene_type:complete
MASITAHKDYTKMIDQLADRSITDRPFDNYMTLFITCAALGVKAKNKHAILQSKSGGKDVMERIWHQNPQHERIIFAVALWETKDIRIFKDKEKCYEIFEQYVNGGLEEMYASYSDHRNADSIFQTIIMDMALSSQDNAEKT